MTTILHFTETVKKEEHVPMCILKNIAFSFEIVLNFISKIKEKIECS